jgi:hypothetical protein
MPACTQPECIGTIVDGYCDVCGSPAGAVPFVPAGASASSPVPANEAGLTAIHRGAGIPPQPRSGNLATACTEPACTGMILDGYCDVCGSPAGAVPFVPTATVGAAAPSAADDSSGFEEAAQGKPNAAAQVYRTRVEQAQLPDDVRVAALREVDRLERTIAQTAECREIRIWLDTILELPWGTKATDWTDDIQGSREIEATLQGLIKPAAAEVEKPDTQAEPAEGEADTEEGDTAEVEPAEAEVEEPDTAKPDTAEVEPAVAEADTEEDDTAEVEPAAAEVEEPAAAEVEEPDAAEIEPAATEVEKPNRAPAGPRDDDTVETPAVLAVPSAGPQPGPQPAPQLREQQVVKPVQVQPPTKKRRRSGPLALAVAALVAVLIGAFFVVTRGGGTAQSVPTATATVSTPTTAPSPKPTGTGLGESPIQLARLPGAGRPLQAVQIQGTYRGGPDTLLRVQREEAGVWVDFPTPTVTDASGKFTTYVELGQPGHYRLRVLNPASGITSATFVLVIKG